MATFSKKHYETLARGLKSDSPDHHTPLNFDSPEARQVIHRLSAILKRDNYLFDTFRFYRAIGMERSE